MPQEQDRAKKIEEINKLINIPGVEEFFFQALAEAKEKFKEKIDNYQKEKGTIPSFKNGLGKDKSYFFELNRVGTPGNKKNYKWVLGKFQLKSRTDLVEMIFSQFIAGIDKYDTMPGKFLSKTVKSPSADKSFEIDFVKNSDHRVVGFVREKERQDVEDTKRMIKVPTRYNEADKQEMYRQIFQLMEDDPEAREDIFYYYLMVQNARGELLNSKS